MTKCVPILLIYFLSSLTIKAQVTYRFTGNGYWSDTANWAGRMMPPALLPSGDVIEIIPAVNGICLLNVPQIISRNGSLVIGEGKTFRIFSDLVQQQSTDDFNLTISDVELLDSSHTLNPAPGQLIGADGTTLGRRTGLTQATGIREQLVNQLLLNAREWCEEKSTITHPGEDSTEPAHNGFAYSYGNIGILKNISERHYPDGGDSLHNSFAVYGTDCTGFLYNLFSDAGLNLQPVPTVLSLEYVLNQALKSSASYKHIHVNNLGRLPVQEIQSGDLLIWKTKGHAGMAGKLLNQDIILFSSHGQPRPMTATGWKIKPQEQPPVAGVMRTAVEEQAENWGMRRGIHPASITTLMTDSQWVTTYEVLRLEEDSLFTDPRDGQTYTYAHIGTQVWMTQNLNYITGNAWYYNNNPAHRSIYGLLYDWQTAMTAVPPGWHLPTLAEWYTLVNTLGGETVAGGKMKSTLLWDSPNTAATNSSGFTGLPGGLRISDGQYESLGTGAFWWSASEYSMMGQPVMAWYYSLSNYTGRGFSWYEDKTAGFSIRCIRN